MKQAYKELQAKLKIPEDKPIPLEALAKLPNVQWFGGADLSKMFDLTGACNLWAI